jgi:hypothetical protein
MDENEKSKVIELTERAIVINEKLLADEKNFIKEAPTSSDVDYLKEKNEQLDNLVRKEHMYLGAAKSRLQKMSEDSVAQ